MMTSGTIAAFLKRVEHDDTRLIFPTLAMCCVAWSAQAQPFDGQLSPPRHRPADKQHPIAAMVASR